MPIRYLYLSQGVVLTYCGAMPLIRQNPIGRVNFCKVHLAGIKNNP